MRRSGNSAEAEPIPGIVMNRIKPAEQMPEVFHFVRRASKESPGLYVT